MSCEQTGIPCNSIQVIEPDASLPVGVAGGTSDPSLTESGEVVLVANQSEVSVTFTAMKASEAYRFEYLYVDAFGIINPGAIEPVVQAQSRYGFTVDLAAVAPVPGYVLRWRVVVIALGSTTSVDKPESLYLQMPWATPPIGVTPIMNILFVNPRSNVNYGFTELRVENLVDPPALQTPIRVQVYEKRTDGFRICFNPLPPTPNYFIAVRTP